MNYENVVIGSGLAGATIARKLQDKNINFHLFYDPSAPKHRPVWISEEGTEDLPEAKMGKRETSSVRLLSAATDYVVKHSPGKYWIIDPVRVIKAFQNSIWEKDKTQVNSKKSHSITRLKSNKFEIIGFDEGIITENIIDAAGINDNIQNRKNFLVEFLHGASFRGSLEDRQMILVFLPDGGTCWIAESVYEGFIDVVYTTWGPYKNYNDFLITGDQRLDTLVKFAKDKNGIHFESFRKQSSFTGMISSQRYNQSQLSGIFPFGEAAQTSRPASQEAANRIFRTADILAEVLKEHETTKHYISQLARFQKRDQFMTAGLMARILAIKSDNTNTSVTSYIYRILQSLPESARDKMEKEIEEWVIRGNVNPRLIIQLCQEPQIRKSLLYAGGAYLISALIGLNRELELMQLVQEKIFRKSY
jgi:hypothetical protein